MTTDLYDGYLFGRIRPAPTALVLRREVLPADYLRPFARGKIEVASIVAAVASLLYLLS